MASKPGINIEQIDEDDIDCKSNSNINQLNIANIPKHQHPLNILFYQDNYNSIRRAKIILFTNGLEHYPSFLEKTSQQKTDILQKIERACYNYTVRRANDNNVITSWSNNLFKSIYHSACYRVSVNIHSETLVENPTFAINILNNTYVIKNIPKMSAPDMNPQGYTKIMQRLEASKNVSHRVKTSALYKCRRCGKNKCSIENVYNRSLDEGVSLKITCQECGNEFGA